MIYFISDTHFAHKLGEGKVFNVCADLIGSTPISIEKILDIMNQLPDNFNLVRRENKL